MNQTAFPAILTRKKPLMNELRKILMITESPFPEDTRVKNEAYSLVEAGYQVTVIALNFNQRVFKENLKGVQVYRLPLLTIFKKSSTSMTWFSRMLYRLKSAVGYILEYVYFTLAAFMLSLYIMLVRGVDGVHLHNPPNTLVVIGATFRMLGKKFVFDHHDLAPELYLSRFNAGKDLLYRILMVEEKLCLKLSHMVIATNESYKKIDVARGGIDPGKIVIVRNGPDPTRFKQVQPDMELKAGGRTLLAYLGVMGPQDGVDYLLHAMHHLVHEMGRNNVLCIIIGPGDSLEDLKELAAELSLNEHVRFTGFIPKSDLLRYLSSADICLDPNPSSPLNDVSTWIKVMEYMAMGKPVVSFDLKETRYSAEKAAVYVPPNDIRAFAQAIADLMDDPVRREEMGRYGRKRIERDLAWNYSAINLVDGYRRISRGASGIASSLDNPALLLKKHR
jgi:glycosyltransferase involved in cell wall biosynthesis